MIRLSLLKQRKGTKRESLIFALKLTQWERSWTNHFEKTISQIEKLQMLALTKLIPEEVKVIQRSGSAAWWSYYVHECGSQNVASWQTRSGRSCLPWKWGRERLRAFEWARQRIRFLIRIHRRGCFPSTRSTSVGGGGKSRPSERDKSSVWVFNYSQFLPLLFTLSFISLASSPTCATINKLLTNCVHYKEKIGPKLGSVTT